MCLLQGSKLDALYAVRNARTLAIRLKEDVASRVPRGWFTCDALVLLVQICVKFEYTGLPI
jgi:hypothetical protein